MGKKKRGTRKPRSLPGGGGAGEDGDSSPDEMYDEIDQFHRRRDLPHLDDGAEAGDSSGNEEVLGVRPDGEGSDDQPSEDEPGGFDESSDDEEGGEENEEDYLPSANAWGKSRKAFYDTSYVDKDYGGFSGSDAEDAELEEQEAKTLQKRLAEAISEQDYGLEDLVRAAPTTAQKSAPAAAEKVDLDIAKLTDDAKLQLFKQQSPELEGLIDEYKEKRDALVHLEPFTDIVKSLQPPDDRPFLEQIRAAMEIYANYLLNIQFYLYAKAANGVTPTNQLKNHPVLDRIMEWRKLVHAADEFIQRSASTLECLLAKLKEGDDLAALIPSRPPQLQQAAKKTKKRKIFEDDEGEEDAFPGHYVADDAQEVEDGGEVGKRAINYEMEKNKGLTAKRRKDIAHSRIKRRKQYDKALIKRRSQVPSVKRELNKYDGELRGIKTSVVKSIKLKS